MRAAAPLPGLVSLALLGACAPASPHLTALSVLPEIGLAAASMPALEYAVHPEGNVRSTSLRPVPVRVVGGPGLPPGAVVTLGATLAVSTEGPRAQLGLVLTVLGHRGQASFSGHPGVLLEVDGRRFESRPDAESPLYRRYSTAYGIHEVVVVPVVPGIVRDIVDARSVRGRLGDWITFTLGPEERGALAPILEAVPAQARFGPVTGRALPLRRADGA